MKKNYFILMFSAIAATTAFGQAQQKHQQLNNADYQNVKPNSQNVNTEKVVYWSEDFANGLNSSNGTWTTGGPDGAQWKHSFYTTSGCYSTGTTPFEPTTYANGFMLFDHDSINCNDIGPDPSVWATYTGELISPLIDLTSVPGAVLEIQQDFRFCCSPTHEMNVSFSTDMVTWSTPIDLTDGAGANDPFLTYNGSYVLQRNITAEAGGQAVYMKFTWDANASGNLAYYWALDDINIIEWPADDIQLLSAWVAGVNNEGMEYGRTPYNQQDVDYFVGAEVYNFGQNDQTNLALSADFTAFTAASTHALLESDSTTYMESTETVGPLPVGMYTGNYTVVSAAETGGAYFGNNTGMREFEVTTDMAIGTCGSLYSLDGIDVYSANALGSIGTDSFTDGEDGLILGTMYHIKADAPVDGLEIYLSSNSTADAQIRGLIVDTADFWAGVFTQPLYETDYYTVTAADITNQLINIPLLDLGAVLNPGAYYACVELFSNGGTSHVRVLDDQTVAQPWYASGIYIPADQSYSNGTATAIRLSYDCLTAEEQTLEGIKVFPNPSEGLINVTNANGYENTIVVYDLAGQVISTMESSSDAVLDLSGAGSGIYVVKVSSANGTFVERVILK